MKIKNLFILAAFSLLLTACGKKETTTADYGVVPLPQKIEKKEGTPFTLSDETKIIYPSGNENLKRVAEFLVDYVNFTTKIQLKAVEGKEGEVVKNSILLQDNLANSNKEAYNLTVDENQIVINGASSAGTFYGVQTLRKSIDADSDGKNVLFPQVTIEDYPRFQYRGMHLDVARHMFPVEFIKKYIDILALHNINTFHWHLTDDQGWRIEIKKYPELTELGSKRKHTVIGRNSGEFDNTPYGGFYTQEEAKEIVQYAKDRFITVIPEIDLPGHMLGALTAYPNLGCTGGPYEVEGTWGVFDDVLCAGNDEIYTFMDNVFTEIVDIFPSEYIHIGGDECPKTQWEKCPKCQAKIKELGLKADKNHTAEQRLQSYVISRAEEIIGKKGRKIIGWDEILEGGLAPNATVMSWTGIQGAITAAKEGHDAIMVPTSHLYFDYYQTTDTENAPLAIGGYVPIEKVYSFDPTPSDLTEEEAKHILGVQANLWVEYIKTPEHVEYMVLPRMDALSEVQWRTTENKDFQEFIPRLVRMTKLYDKEGYNYAKTIFGINVDTEVNTEAGQLEITLSSIDNAAIHYTIDGTEPTENSPVYNEKIIIKEPTTLKAEIFRGGKDKFKYSNEFKLNKASLKPITLNNDPKGTYAFGGAKSLVDGKTGNQKNYKDGSWIGFNDGAVEATIDLKSETEFSNVKVGSYVCTGDWIFGIKGLTVATSQDGKTFTEVAKESFPEADSYKEFTEVKEITFPTQKARYIRVTIDKTEKLPSWHSGKGLPAYLFIDEIILN